MLISSRFVKVLSPLAVAIALASCGGGGGSFGEGATGNGVSEEGGKITDQVINSIDLQASSIEILSDGTQTINITAIVKDAANSSISDAEVTFSVDNNATLIVTDSTAALTPNGAAPGTILNVTATSGLISKTIQIKVIAVSQTIDQRNIVNSIDLQATSTELLADGSESIDITAIAKNQFNNAIDAAVVSFSVDNNATLIIDNNVAKLNSNGSTAGTVLTVTATSGEVTKTILINVIAAPQTDDQANIVSSIDLQATSAEILADGSESIDITAIAKNQFNNAVDTAVVSFSVDNNATLIVDNNVAKLKPNGSTVGTVLTVTAIFGEVTKVIQINVVASKEFIAQNEQVDSIDLQTNSFTLLSDGSQLVSIDAVAKDASNVSISDAVINFSVDKNATLVVTGNSVILTPGNVPAGEELTITATVSKSTGTVTKTITIDVVEKVAEGQASDIEFTASSRLLPSDGSKPITLSATAKDGNNNAIVGANITFSVDNGATINYELGQEGTVAVATLTPSTPENRTLNVTVTSGSQSKTIIIEVVGTNVTIDGPSAVTLNKEVPYVLKLKDSADKPIAFEKVELTSSAGNTLASENNFETDASGEIAFSLIGIAGGNDILSAKVLGVTYTKNVEISGDEFVLSGNSDEININTNVPINFIWKKDGVPQANKQITISATRGTINNTSIITNSSGEATFTITSTTAGQTVITATSTAGLSSSLQREFIALTPAYLNTQAEPSTISPNKSSTIVAKIRDINDNPVKNKTIDFRLSDKVNGILSASTAVTDSLGRASVSYTAGNSSSAKDGVIINTFIQGYPAVASDEVLLTVGGDALRIVLGHDENLAEVNEVLYMKRYGVIVTDSAGNPIKDQEVSFTITPTHYYKGFMRTVDTDNDGEDDLWVRYLTAPRCVSEDFDNDGNLDIGEDLNGNGLLEPTHDATITSTGVTNAEGVIVIEVIYPQSRALWTDQLITAKTRVEGTEFVEYAEYLLGITAEDARNVKSSVANALSPYGISNSCLDDSDSFSVPITPQVVNAVTNFPVTVLENDIWYSVQFTDALGAIATGQTFSINSAVVDIEEDQYGNFRLSDQDPTADNTGFNMTLTVGNVITPLYYQDAGIVAPPVSSDTTGPQILITGINPRTINQGEVYSDAGATAIDDVDGAVTPAVISGLPLDSNILGTHTIVYKATDAAGNSTTANRTVNVVPDTTPPVISLVGNSTIFLTVGDSYTESGATATDNVDTISPGSISIDNSAVDTNNAGTYIVTYNVSDSSGNAAIQVTRSVVVNP